MKITPMHIAAGFAGGAALIGGATVAGGFAGKNGDIHPLTLGTGLVAVTALTGGMVFANKLYATNPMGAAALFATGLGAAGGFMFGLPAAAAIAQARSGAGHAN